jgi:gluconolactonase
MLSASLLTEDPRFLRLVLGNVGVEKLFTGARWSEGPAYFPAGKYLVWSDIPNDRLLRFDETDGSVSTFEQPCRYQNGHTVDLQGRLIGCEHGGRCVSRIEHDGRRTVLADRYGGRRLNSPNDVVVKSDGSVWFTDPTYGIDGDYEGHRSAREQDGSFLYRVDPDSGEVQAVSTDFVQPNGLAFSPDEAVLYVSDTGATHVDDGPRHIRALTLAPEGASVRHSRIFAHCRVGHFDGFRVDRQGNLWASTGEGVHCYAPDGTLIGKILIPEVVGNVEFGGPKRNRLYICATTSLYAMFLNTSACLRTNRADIDAGAGRDDAPGGRLIPGDGGNDGAAIGAGARPAGSGAG